MKQFKKFENLNKIADVLPPGLKNFDISPKMRCFGHKSCKLGEIDRVILSHFSGKRLEKLEIRQNWPF